MKTEVSLHWFRKDLRFDDNPSLNSLSKIKKPVILLYIYDDSNVHRDLGSAAKIWLGKALEYLNSKCENKLILQTGNPISIFFKLIENFNIKTISWNRCYDPWSISRDKLLKESLKDKNIKILSHNGSLLWEPWKILKNDGTPYKVFTPFYKRGCLESSPPRPPRTEKIDLFYHNFKSPSLEQIGLKNKSKWANKIIKNWQVGESYAQEVALNFLEKNTIKGYAEKRNFPYLKKTSRLSPYIHWGQISPNFLWYKAIESSNGENSRDVATFQSELGWREFSYYLLYHFPTIHEKNFQQKFDRINWKNINNNYESWKHGKTGFPIIDAGMRELWETGYMHNRVRMIVGSFLTKNLFHYWKFGEEWFWDCLFDADTANNSAGWQWVAGTGADAAPYFRIFNPISQGQKFDPEGKYIKKFVPELKNIPLKFVNNPWECPEEILIQSGVVLGKDYPMPIVDLKESRELALTEFKRLKN